MKDHRRQDFPTSLPQPWGDPSWLIEVERFDPSTEPSVESWLTVGNGRTGTRGSIEEDSRDSAPALYVAGLYGATEGESPALVLATGPDWTHLDPRIEGEALGLERGDILEHRRILDLRQGVLFRIWRQRLPSGEEVTFRSARFASLADRALLALRAEATSERPVSLAGPIPLYAEGALESAKLRLRGGRLGVEAQGRGGRRAHFTISTRTGPGWVERVAAVARAAYDDGGAVEEALAHADSEGIAGLFGRHRATWEQRWRDADVVIEGDDAAQRAMRFALYHLISAADPESDAASIGARGLTGRGYNGHVFWDTEVFMVPFFIYTHPPTARALLAYRYRTLPAAQKKAADYGYRGALYAWESADTGEDVTPDHVRLKDGIRIPVITAQEEHHISADIAWATWQYWRATGDEAFLAEMGAEIILETARFWASRARKDGDGRYHIDGVMGPDEYHESTCDNVFTNKLARWNLERGLELVDLVARIDSDARDELWSRLNLSNEELARWRQVAKGMVDGFDPETLLYEQFSGFFQMEEVLATDLAPRPFPGEQILGIDRLRQSQVIKQADVIMLAHMLPELMPANVVDANYRFYEPRTSHGSSLSPAIYAGVAARIGDLEEALDRFHMAVSIDLGDRMDNSSEGVHLATTGGLWQAAVLGFGGLRPEGEAVRIDPRIPASWDRLAFALRWRGARLEIEADGKAVEIGVEGRACVGLGLGPSRWLEDVRYAARRTTAGWSDLSQTT